jgi:hypothetical protein
MARIRALAEANFMTAARFFPSTAPVRGLDIRRELLGRDPIEGGPEGRRETAIGNLVSLCRFHHRRHHEGKFRIEPDGSGDFSFTAADGKPILVVDPQPAVGSLDRTGLTDPSLARVRDGGAPYRREYAVSVIADQVASNREASAREAARRRQADDEQLMRELLAEERVASGRDTSRSRTPVALPRAGPKTAP